MVNATRTARVDACPHVLRILAGARHTRFGMQCAPAPSRSTAPSARCSSQVLANLRLVVVDEAHAYHGVFGSHVALVLRRLRRLCTHYGAAPKFVCCSATIACPLEHMAELTGLSPAEIWCGATPPLPPPNRRRTVPPASPRLTLLPPSPPLPQLGLAGWLPCRQPYARSVEPAAAHAQQRQRVA